MIALGEDFLNLKNGSINWNDWSPLSSQIEKAKNSQEGFVWGYLDLLNPSGDGCVIVASYGLPFLPKKNILPKLRPSINLAVYKKFKPEFYLLQEMPAFDVLKDDQFPLKFSVTVPGFKNRLLEVEIKIKESRPLRFILAHSIQRTQTISLTSFHLWTPRQMAASGEVKMSLGSDWNFISHGRVYHDFNLSPKSLVTLGIKRWIWGRFPQVDGSEIVFYFVEGQNQKPVCWGFHVSPSGEVIWDDQLEIELGSSKKFLWGHFFPKKIKIKFNQKTYQKAYTIEPISTLDQGPFYLRFFATLDDSCVGFLETVLPTRMDQPFLNPLIKMRIHQAQHLSQNSFWLPLFQGPKKGRFKRLLRVF